MSLPMAIFLFLFGLIAVVVRRRVAIISVKFFERLRLPHGTEATYSYAYLVMGVLFMILAVVGGMRS